MYNGRSKRINIYKKNCVIRLYRSIFDFNLLPDCCRCVYVLWWYLLRSGQDKVYDTYGSNSLCIGHLPSHHETVRYTVVYVPKLFVVFFYSYSHISDVGIWRPARDQEKLVKLRASYISRSFILQLRKKAWSKLEEGMKCLCGTTCVYNN